MAYAASTEDLDLMALGCSKMIRGIKKQNKTFEEIDLEEVLKGLDLSMDSFVDLCILVFMRYFR